MKELWNCTKSWEIFFPDLNIELIAELAAEVSREMSPQDIRLVAEMAQQMGPELSAGEVQVWNFKTLTAIYTRWAIFNLEKRNNSDSNPEYLTCSQIGLD